MTLARPTVATLALSMALASAAGVFQWINGAAPPVSTDLPEPLLLATLCGLFFFAEHFLLNVEFRRQAHSLTLAGVPLVLAILTAPTHTIVLVRVIGSLTAFVIQRISLDKIAYNVSAYAFEAAVGSVVARNILGAHHRMDVYALLAVIAIVAAVDQLMSCLVLLVIRLHNGPMTRRDVITVLGPAAGLSAASSCFAFIVLVLLERGVIGVVLVAVLLAVQTAAYRSHSATRRRHQALTLVHNFVADGVGTESLESLAAELLRRIRELLRAAHVELVLLDGNHTVGVPAVGAATVLAIGEDGKLTVSSRQVDPSDWLTIRVLSQEESILARRDTKDAGLQRWLHRHGVRDAVIVPLPASSGLIGALSATDRLGELTSFTADDLTLMETLTGHLAVAVRSTRLLEKLAHEATHDALTGLANRAFLTRRLAEALTDSVHQPAVLLLDLDRFKEVNDAFGHDVGDRLLTVIAQRLHDCLPDSATVARLGGDEFAILLPHAPSRDELCRLVTAVGDHISQPVHFEEALLSAEASIGVAIAANTVHEQDLLRQADTAMYDAKAHDQRYALYTPDMDRGRAERLALLADLRTALKTAPDQIVLHYQPKIDIHTGALVGAEALARWNHPTLGVILPDRFIPLAEAAGLADELTPHVLRTAIQAAHRWNATTTRPLDIAVNLSARNVSNPGLPQLVKQLLEESGLQPQHLILEITESSIMADTAQTLPILNALKSLGVSLALDDFGTGYSSLSYLQKLPIDEIKIDRSFVSGLGGPEDVHSRALISSITGLALNLNLRVVAEGIETDEHLTHLQHVGCHVGQGYLISRPLNEAAFEAWTLKHADRKQLRLVSHSQRAYA
ncbi:MAG: EAL domain-containing protein [Actinobacteria bacterium]|nr:EAL domain-containing protein [Actinomycetota bacterium]